MLRASSVALAALAAYLVVLSIGSTPALAATATVTNVSPDSYECDQSSFIDFETFDDRTSLSARTFPGVHFTTTDGVDWIVGDFDTGNYNGKYPSGGYTSRGSRWAWLGEAQGRGRIDLARPAKNFSLLVSAGTDVVLEAYDRDGAQLAVAGPTSSNVNTGTMDELRVARDDSDIAYLEVHDSGNFFLVDGVCTDAAGAQPRNDPRNVPPGFADDSDFWTWPDADVDGIPDHWERNGVWVSNRYVNLHGLGAEPRHKDLFLWADAVNPAYADQGVRELIRKAFDGSLLVNPDGRRGVRVHWHTGRLDLNKASFGTAASLDDVARVLKRSAGASGYLGDPVAGDQSVPPLFKYLFFGEKIGGGATGFALHIPGSEAMISVSDATLDSVGDLVWETGRFWPGESRSFVRAVVATHELGHLLGLRHHGNRDDPNPDGTYKSVMTYRYSTFGLPPSGFASVAQVIDYSRAGSVDPISLPPAVNLDWRVDSGAGAIKFLRGQFAVGAANFYLEWRPGEFRAPEAQDLEAEAPLREQAEQADPTSVGSFVQTFSPGGGSNPPSVDPPGTQSGGDSNAHRRQARVAARVLGWHAGRLYVRLRCPKSAPSRCRVSLAILSPGKRKSSKKLRPIARRAVRVGRGATVTVALPRVRRLSARRTFSLRVATTTTGGVVKQTRRLRTSRQLARRPKTP